MATTTELPAARRAAAEALREARHVTAVCHEHPDADTLGAGIAVRLVAERLGAEAEVVCASPLPPALGFLPRIEDVVQAPRLTPELAVICDAGSLARIGSLATSHASWLDRARIVNVDHHRSNELFGEINLVDPTAAASCEVLAGLVGELGIELDAELATALLAGIVRDSGGFASPSVRPETLRLAARLMEAGADLAGTHRRTLATSSAAGLRLWGLALANMRVHLDGRLVAAAVTTAMLAEAGAAIEEAEGLVEFMARANGVEAAVLARELAPGQRTRISVRSGPSLDAIAAVRPLGGGGHPARAGCIVELGTDEALDRVVGECLRALGA